MNVSSEIHKMILEHVLHFTLIDMLPVQYVLVSLCSKQYMRSFVKRHVRVDEHDLKLPRRQEVKVTFGNVMLVLDLCYDSFSTNVLFYMFFKLLNYLLIGHVGSRFQRMFYSITNTSITSSLLPSQFEVANVGKTIPDKRMLFLDLEQYCGSSYEVGKSGS